MSSLYQRVLGPNFTELAPVLRRFHTHPTGGSATGRLAVEHGASRAARLLVSLMGLPVESPREEVHLQVTVDDQQEIWDRKFGQRRMRTRQRHWGRLLLESTGLVVLGFELLVEDGGMHFEQRGAWLLGLKLPRFIAPRASCKVTPTGEKWKLDVRLELPLVGPLIRYHGVMAPTQQD
jgi:uncharacterized protein DUF4166